MKTLIGINTLTVADQLAYTNHFQFAYRLGKESKDEFLIYHPRRQSIDMMRNTAAKIALEQECDYILFIDDDVLIPITPVNVYERLKKDNKDVIAGVTLIRGYPYHPMIFQWDNDEEDSTVVDYKEKADKDGLLACDAVGFSFCLIRVEILRDLDTPYFVTGINHTEDIYFCQKLREANEKATIFADTTIETAHIIGSGIISPVNLKARKEFDEAMSPEIVVHTPRDRPQDYLNEVQNSILQGKKK